MKYPGKAVVVGSTIAVIMLLTLAMAVATEPTWMIRPGTIGNALQQSDGTTVTLDAVVVDKIKLDTSPTYFVIRECFDKDARIIILTDPPIELRLGECVDIEGVVTTLPDGDRAIINTTVTAYTDSKGKILYHGPLVKGPFEPIPWQWKQVLTSPFTTSTMLTLLDDPNPDPIPAPIPCSTLSSLSSLDDGTRITLDCKPIDEAYSSYFILAEDGSGDTIKVYYTHSISTDNRINNLTGYKQTEDGSPVICTDDGPGYNYIMDPPGGVVTASPGSIAYALTQPNGSTVSVTGKIVIADRYDFDGALYLEEQDRTTGIRVTYSGDTSVFRGAVVNATGTISLNSSGEREIAAGITGITVISSMGSIPRVLGVINRDLGGSAFNASTPGITYPTTSSGLYNKGLLVKIWGKVTYSNLSTQTLYIDDGSAISNGVGNPVGVKVIWTSEGGTTSVPAVDTYVTNAVGISSSEERGTGQYARILRVRNIATPTLSCSALNGAVDLLWTAQDNTDYRVYRGTNVGGPFNTLATTGNGTYRDNSVSNGTTYYYKVAGVVAGVEGTASKVISATPSTSQPTVTITSTQVTDGVLHVYFTASGGWTPEQAALLIDDNPVDILDPSYEPLHFAYQTTESTNGNHTVTVELSAGVDPFIVATASSSVNFNNELSTFCAVDAGDDASSNEAIYIYGTWDAERPWTIEITDAYDNPVKTITGYGTVVDYTWDGKDQYGNPTYTDARYYVQLSTSQSSSSSAKGKTAVYRPTKRTGPPFYIAFYPSEDPVSGFPNAFRNRCLCATDRLRLRFQAVTHSQDPWAVASDGWDYPMIGNTIEGAGYLDDARILHYTGHGSPSSIGGSYDDGWWHGYRALDNWSNGTDQDWIGLGQHFGNWFRGRCRVTGRVIDIDMPIRYRAVFLDGCNTGGVARARHLYWPFVFGIAHPGNTTRISKGSCYIGWMGPAYPTASDDTSFVSHFWYNYVTYGYTLQQSVDQACTSSGVPRSRIRVVGDRNMRL